ncbi:MAG TPA: SigB/SigF/SigG family RNA polymerase sigma factor [Solirubrobacteraceae bacterium]|nr:SigB/SigF/SigG family RNA polymerase sigma factor [Solirubrobacteraceae bacterium]
MAIHTARHVEGERAQFARWQRHGDQDARAALIERYLPLARRLARRYAQADEPLDDLVQVAAIGLVKAVDRFDVQRPVAFSSYAVPTILGELKRHFRDRTWSMRVPRDLQELALRADRVAEDLSGELGRRPTISELARALEIGEEQVLEAIEAAGAYRAASLEAPRRSEDADETVGDGVGLDEPGFGLAEDRALLARLMNTLTEHERLILRLRFEQDLTQSEIGDAVGISQMQVSRIIRRCLGRLSVAAAAGHPG